MEAKREYVKEQIKASFDTNYKIVERYVDICSASVRLATLKEVGKHLKTHGSECQNQFWWTILKKDLESLLHGEMPADEK